MTVADESFFTAVADPFEPWSTFSNPVPEAADDPPEAMPANSDLSFTSPFEVRQWVAVDTG
ncbi:MAG: hypothetical protein K2Z80_09715 [Xanthobacteraceae bacterium]|nr:hypothetical protein [Xanthobacteraceae bacterium]